MNPEESHCKDALPGTKTYFFCAKEKYMEMDWNLACNSIVMKLRGVVILILP